MALESDTPTPNDVTPPINEDETQRILAQEHAQLASMMSLDSGPIRHFKLPAESPFTAAVSRETSAAPATASDSRNEVEQSWGAKWLMLLATAAVLVFAPLGVIQWRSYRNHASNGPVEAIQTKIPDVTRSNLEEKGYNQSGMPTDSETHPSSAAAGSERRSRAAFESLTRKAGQ